MKLLLWYDTICVSPFLLGLTCIWYYYIYWSISIDDTVLWWYDTIDTIVADLTYRCWYWLTVVFIDGIIMIEYCAVCVTQADADIVDVVIINYSWYFTLNDGYYMIFYCDDCWPKRFHYVYCWVVMMIVIWPVQYLMDDIMINYVFGIVVYYAAALLCISIRAMYMAVLRMCIVLMTSDIMFSIDDTLLRWWHWYYSLIDDNIVFVDDDWLLMIDCVIILLRWWWWRCMMIILNDIKHVDDTLLLMMVLIIVLLFEQYIMIMMVILFDLIFWWCDDIRYILLMLLPDCDD
jgi:hypothetical protein